MWLGHKARSPQRIPKVMQLLTTIAIPLSWLWREVWKCKRRIANIILVWADRQNHSGHLSTMVTPAPTDQRLRIHPAVHPACGRRQSYQRPHPSSAWILLPFVAKDQEDFFCCPCKVKGFFLLLDAAPLRGTEFSATPSRKIRRQCHNFLKCHPVSSTIVQAGNITFPSFLPVHSFPCLEKY